MKILDTIPLLLEALVLYLKLKNKTAVYDLVNAAENRIDKLNERREKLRKQTDSKSQDEASKIMDEILDEKRKVAIFIEDAKRTVTDS